MIRGPATCAWRVQERERQLPVDGKVLAEPGQQVEPDTVIARAEMPGPIVAVDAAGSLDLEPPALPAAMRKQVGAFVHEGEVIARRREIWGLVHSRCTAPVCGTITSVSEVTGQVMIAGPAAAIELRAYVHGEVVRIVPRRGAVVRTEGYHLHGVFGIGGETCGRLEPVVRSPDDRLVAGDMGPQLAGMVLVGGAVADLQALRAAAACGVAAVVTGGIDDRDLCEFLGREIGVGVTGAEAVGLTIVVTEGFGALAMDSDLFELLCSAAGVMASVNGATQIRAGVLRPEVLIPREAPAAGGGEPAPSGGTRLARGGWARIVASSYFGRCGRVIDLPASAQVVDSGARLPVVVLELSDGETVTVPAANVESIAAKKE